MALPDTAPQRLRALMGADILEISGRPWTGRDLVTAGAIAGDWITLEHDLAAGLVALDMWQPETEAVRGAVREFRYERKLISGEDYGDWLTARELSAGDVRAVMSRMLARRWAATQRPESEVTTSIGRGHDHAFAERIQALAAEAICSGTLTRCGRWLIDRLVCLDAAPDQDVPEAAVDTLLATEDGLIAAAIAPQPDEERRRRAMMFLAAERAYEARVCELSSDRAIETCLRQHALDWLTFDLDELRCGSAGAAAEAAALLREGAEVARIGPLAGVPVHRQTVYLDDAPAPIQGLLGAAAPGTVVGPTEIAGEHHVWCVRTRRTPSAADADCRARAAAEVISAYMNRARAGKVRWHDDH